MNKKAFTLVELSVVAGIIVLVLIVALLLRGGAASADKKLSGLEEYYNLQARLESSLKQDLRSAAKINKIAQGHYELHCLKLENDSKKTVLLTVVYKTAGKDSLRVERFVNKKRTSTFDFKSFAKERKLKFEIKNLN